MEQKEKYRAEMDARLNKFNQTLHELKEKTAQKRETMPDLELGGVMQKHAYAETKLKELERSDQSTWQKVKAELDDLVDDIDDEIRKAWAYFG